eukprot:CAMPEP_0198287592 /NCGR_PEP_ID=MMETSP1449-20131203/6349_1 /TAXON_ID=420275 /ORGANISM="Attheya septentrionalis, Strain CCMP2084" /LENGTH=72 /DNA_ID=CAMNT_0043985557 /DNA_START=37 /DNA_END=252 /DNA_ORIENTATION=-
MERIKEALVVYEEALEKSGGPFLMGEHFTLSDVHILPCLSRLVPYFLVREEPFPTKILTWYDACSNRYQNRR